MTVLPWPGSAALQRAKALHPAARVPAALGSSAGPTPPASPTEDGEHPGDSGETEDVGRAAAPRLWLVAGGATE
jgi:hypothetical protein